MGTTGLPPSLSHDSLLDSINMIGSTLNPVDMVKC